MLWKIPLGYGISKSHCPHGYWDFPFFSKSLKYMASTKFNWPGYRSSNSNSPNGSPWKYLKSYTETTFMLLYRSLVTPHLEVSNSAWFPILKQDIDTIEDVQRRATRQLPGFRDLDYEQRLQLLGLPSLPYRRLRGDMIETFKIVNDHYDQEVAPV